MATTTNHWGAEILVSGGAIIEREGEREEKERED